MMYGLSSHPSDLYWLIPIPTPPQIARQLKFITAIKMNMKDELEKS